MSTAAIARPKPQPIAARQFGDDLRGSPTLGASGLPSESLPKYGRIDGAGFSQSMRAVGTLEIHAKGGFRERSSSRNRHWRIA
jgi:hypothetical protein